MAILT